MKFIKYAIGLVIALSVIPLVVVTINKLDAPKLITVEFEVIDMGMDGAYETITFTENAYNDVNSLAVLDSNRDVTNLIAVKLNGNEMEEKSFGYSTFNYYIYKNVWNFFGSTNIAVLTNNTSGYTPTINDKWTLIFEIPNPNPLPPLIKTLVGFIPLLLAGGVVLFMLNKRKL